MKRLTMTLMILALAAPAFAGFQGEEVDEGLHFVSYERGRWTAGSVLDTASKARRKIERLANDYCLAEGYSYMRFVSFGEISRDEELRQVWELANGDMSADSYEISDGRAYLGMVAKTHKTVRLMRLSEVAEEGWTACVSQR